MVDVIKWLKNLKYRKVMRRTAEIRKKRICWEFETAEKQTQCVASRRTATRPTNRVRTYAARCGEAKPCDRWQVEKSELCSFIQSPIRIWAERESPKHISPAHTCPNLSPTHIWTAALVWSSDPI